MRSTRTAFTLIEIVFTILLLGIIATGLPMLLIGDADTREETIVQEAIYASTAKMSQLLSYAWDENSIAPLTSTVASSKVLDINSTTRDIEFDRNGLTKFRLGHFVGTGRRSLYDISITNRFSSAIGFDAGETNATFDDIDDDIGTVTFIESTGTTNTSSIGYKENYRMNISVSYIDVNNTYGNNFIAGMEFENPVATTTNMKRITVQITDNQTPATTLFTLKTFSSNIGETSIASRVFF